MNTEETEKNGITIYFKAFYAVGKGLHYCLFCPAIRRLAVWPWIVGTFCYFAAFAAMFRLHPLALEWLIAEPSGFWSTALYLAAWLFLWLGLLVAGMILCVVLVMLFTSVFQTAIAANVLRELGRSVPEETPGLKGIVKETTRTVAVESLKLIWLLPLLLLALIVGFIPLLAPFAIILGAWLLAYQFIDVVLDIYRLKAGARFRFALKHSTLAVCFGLTLTLCWAIPFMGILLPPAAVAAAAWLLSESGLLNAVEKAAIPAVKPSNNR